MKYAIFFGFMLAGIQNLYSSTPHFSSDSISALKLRAAAEHKYIFIDIYTTWCGPCKYLATQVFPDSAVSSLLNDHFVLATYDAEKGYGITVAMKYRIRGFPTLIILNEKGQFLRRIFGAYPTDMFADTLRAFLQNPPAPNTSISESLDMGFPDYYERFFAGKLKVKDINQKTVEEFIDRRGPFSEAGWSVLSEVYKGEKYGIRWLAQNNGRIENLYGRDEWLAYRRSLYYLVLQTLDTLPTANLSKFDTLIGSLALYADTGALDLAFELKSAYYFQTKHYTLLADAVDAYYAADFSARNDIAYNLYLAGCPDQAVNRRAVQWMKRICEKQKRYPEMDTYASILFLDREYDYAEKIAKEAIELGKTAKVDTKVTEGLLAKIQEVRKAQK